jgi:hypothetical protein
MGAKVSTSEKIRRIVHEIDRGGNASLTRLTVLKKWLEIPNRLPALGLWIANRAASDNAGKEPGEAALIEKARVFLQGMNGAGDRDRPLDQRSMEAIHKQASQYKREFRNQQWGPVRVVHSWPLYLIEGGLALVVGPQRYPTDGYKLASNWAQNYDPRYGNGFNGPSRGKLVALAEWMEEKETEECEFRKGDPAQNGLSVF